MNGNGIPSHHDAQSAVASLESIRELVQCYIGLDDDPTYRRFRDMHNLCEALTQVDLITQRFFDVGVRLMAARRSQDDLDAFDAWVCANTDPSGMPSVEEEDYIRLYEVAEDAVFHLEQATTCLRNIGVEVRDTYDLIRRDFGSRQGHNFVIDDSACEKFVALCLDPHRACEIVTFNMIADMLHRITQSPTFLCAIGALIAAPRRRPIVKVSERMLNAEGGTRRRL